MKTKAIIIDMDGTMVNNANIDHGIDGSSMTKEEWEAFNMQSANAEPNAWCKAIVDRFTDHRLIFLTARSGSQKIQDMTYDWLSKYLNGRSFTLLMRLEDDFRPDYIFKTDIYHTSIEPYYDVTFALDDKRKICNMWRSLGVIALQCEDY